MINKDAPYLGATVMLGLADGKHPCGMFVILLRHSLPCIIYAHECWLGNGKQQCCCSIIVWEFCMVFRQFVSINSTNKDVAALQ